MLEGVPNFALAFGYTNASWTLKCDLTCEYVCRLLNHLHESGLRQCTPHNNDPSVVAAPMLHLTSGYVQRSADRVPQAGHAASRGRSTRAICGTTGRSGAATSDDAAMVFSNPVPAADVAVPA